MCIAVAVCLYVSILLLLCTTFGFRQHMLRVCVCIYSLTDAWSGGDNLVEYKAQQTAYESYLRFSECLFSLIRLYRLCLCRYIYSNHFTLTNSQRSTLTSVNIFHRLEIQQQYHILWSCISFFRGYLI